MLENNPVIEKISHLIKTTKYGVVSIVIQDSRVVQIEKTEKFRLNPVRDITNLTNSTVVSNGVNKSDSKKERIKENFAKTDQTTGG